MARSSWKRRPCLTHKDRLRRQAIKRRGEEIEAERRISALALQARIVGAIAPLPDTPGDLLAGIQGRLANAQSRGILTNSPQEVLNVYLHQNPPKSSDGPTINLIVGGEKDFGRDKTVV